MAQYYDLERQPYVDTPSGFEVINNNEEPYDIGYVIQAEVNEYSAQEPVQEASFPWWILLALGGLYLVTKKGK